MEIPGEMGVCLQHLGILIGRKTRAAVWSENCLLDGLTCRSSRPGSTGPRWICRWILS